MEMKIVALIARFPMFFGSTGFYSVIGILCILSIRAQATDYPATASDDDFIVFDPKKFSFSATFENSGDNNTGDHRILLVAQNSNLFNKQQLAHIGYYTSPTKPKDLHHFFAGYELPFSQGLDRLILSGYVSQQDFVTRGSFAQDPFGGVYNGYSIEAHYSKNVSKKLIEKQYFDHTIDIGLRFQRSDTAFNELGDEFDSSVDTAPVSLSYEGAFQHSTGLNISGFVRYLHNLNIGPYNDKENYEQNRVGADPNYDLIRAALAMEYKFTNNWLFSTEIFAQYADEPLIAPVTFTLGGFRSVRALEQGEAFGDMGIEGTIQLFTDSFFNDKLAESYFVIFADAGAVRRQDVPAGLRKSESAIGIGAGWRWRGWRGCKKYLTADVDVTYLLDGSILDDSERSTDDRTRILFSITATFDSF